VDAVRQRRERMGIPNPDPVRWSDEEVALIGTATDQEVARRLGRSEQAVRLKRQKLGIPAYGQRRPA
jgi:hypothetical protein